MKKISIIAVLVTILFLNMVSASNVGLIENLSWQSNLISSQYKNLAIFGDINNDERIDIIESGLTNNNPVTIDKTRIYINNGSSFEESSQWESNLTNNLGPAALGDFNNDGKLDLILSGYPAKIYINNGTSFVENATWGGDIPTNAGSSSTRVGDINNDGLLDLIFVELYETNYLVYLNNGTSFVNSSSWSSGVTNAGGKLSSILADFNNDGLLDLNIMGLNSAKGYINNGTNFVYDYNWDTGVADEGSIVGGDVDNDGYWDIVISRVYGGCGVGDVIFTNNGSEFMSNSSWDGGMTGYQYGSLAFGDYDNNGFLDLASIGVCAGISSKQILSNNGTTFEEDLTSESNVTGERYSSALWGDVDNDLDLDLVIIRSQKVYINNGTTPNTVPKSPISFSSSYNNKIIKIGWQNGSDNETSSTGLYYNLMVGISSNNHSIISGVYGGQGDQDAGGTTGGYFGNMMQRKNFSLKVDRLQPSTTYYWYVQTIDTGLAKSNWSARQSFTTPSDMEQPNITLNAPADNLNSSSYVITFNATIFDNLNLTNVSLWGNWLGGWHLNKTNSSGINNTNYVFIVNLTGEADGTYRWMIQAEDNATNIINSTIRTFRIDTTKPNITIIYPTNNTNYTTNTLNVNYSVSDNIFLANCWYSNDSFSVNTSLASCGNITSITWAEGTHNIRIYANDSVGNVNVSSVTFFIDTIKPQISIIFPSNNTNSTNINLDINYTVFDTNLASCWYSNDTYSVNTSLASCGNLTDIIWTEAKHNVTIWANDSFGNVNYSRVSFMIDNSTPLISLISPENSSIWTSSLTVTFYYNVTDVEIANCSLIINGALNETDTSITTLTTQSFSKTLTNENYNWSVNCTDYVGYTNTSEIRNLSVSYTVPSNENPPSGGGGGGGETTTFWTKTETVNDANFSAGVEKELSSKERIKFNVSGEEHAIGIININSSLGRATINISSNPIQIILGIGEEAKVDVSKDGFYDIYIKLISILNNKVNLTIKGIRGEISLGGGNVETNGTIVNNEEEKTINHNGSIWIAVSIGVLIIIVVIVYFLIIRKNASNNEKKDAKILKSEMRKLERYKKWQK